MGFPLIMSGFWHSLSLMAESNEPDLPLPLPLEIVDDDVASEAVFGSDELTPYTPMGTVGLFWQALLNGREEYMTALQTLSNHPPAFGDYSDVEATLNGYSLMQIVEHPDGFESQIAYVKFMPDTGHSMRAFGDAELHDYVVLTVISDGTPGGPWLVWGYSKDDYPAVDEIFDR